MTERLPIITEKPEPAIAVPPGAFSGNVSLVTLGCAKNQVDSEIMLGALQQRGFRPVGDPADADLIVVNTCAFLQSAVEEGIDRILELAQYKSGRCRRLVVAGCMVERYRKELERSLPEVDRFLSLDEITTVANESKTSEECFNEARRPYFLYDETMPRVVSGSGASAFVKISEGCDRPCAFCIIPRIRGSFRSRPVDSIVAEAAKLRARGVCELNLVAQDLTAYGSDLTGYAESRGKSRLIELLESLTALGGRNDRFWIRLLYAYPIGVSEDLLRTITASPAVCNYLDLPLQHISHSVLKRMQRPLGEKGTRRLIERIRADAPQIALRTTMILGFPGETEEDVRTLEQFISEGHFTHVGAFVYSQEAEAKSFNFANQVPEEVKEERRGRIMACQQGVVAERFRRLIGSQLEVLIEGPHEETDLLLSSRAEWQAPETDGLVIINEVTPEIQAAEHAQLSGRFGKVRITEVAGYDLVGELIALI